MTDTNRTMPIIFARAFTLIEIVMVVAIIALLAAITIGVGASMADSGRKRATEGVLQVLDQTLADYIANSGSNPPSIVAVTLEEDFGGNARGDIVYYPAVDGVIDVEIPSDDPGAPVRHYRINSIGLYLESIGQSSDVESLLSSIDGSMISYHDLDDDLDFQPRLLTVFDAWGNPIRYVHPKFDGIIEDSTGPADRRELGEAGDALDILDTSSSGPGFFTAESLPTDLSFVPFDGIEIRRNKILQIDQEEARQSGGLDYPVETDSDGGKCPSQRPYFYSAGPDGDPATIEDNVYTTKPEFVSPF